MGEGPIILLPDDELLRSALEKKLKEYEERLNSLRQQNPFMHPQLFNQMYSHSVYKHLILKKLLEKGQVETYEFSVELAEEHEGFLDADAYNDAAWVIDDYCKNGGRNVHGGTGLVGITRDSN